MNTIFIAKDNNSYEYILFMLETIIEEYKLENYVNESIILASTDANINQIRIVHETFKNKMKNVFTKLLETISKLWGKFVETMDSLFKKNTDYLNKYKNIIINGKIPDDLEYMTYPYWDSIRFILDSEVPAFNYNALKEDLLTEETFLNKYFKNYIKEGTNFTDRVKQIMRGAEKEQRVKANTLNREEMFKYCYEFPDLIKKIEISMKEIQKAGNEAIDIILSMPTATTNENAIYSYIKDTVIYEIQRVTPIEDKEEKENETPKSTESNIKNISGEHEGIDTESIENTVKEKSDAIERIKLYVKICYGFLGAKMAIAQEAYKAYIFILRDIIRVNVGERKASKSTTKSEPETTKEEPEPVERNWVDKAKNIVSRRKEKR